MTARNKGYHTAFHLIRILKRSLFYFVFIFGALFIGPGCGKQTCSFITVTPPDITLTGPKTSVERQIMGDYKELERDAWLVSSARSGEGGESLGKGSRALKEIKVFRSFVILEENRNRLKDYLGRGIIGENNKGYVQKVSKELDKEASAKLDIESLVLTINNARKSLFLSLLSDTKELNMSLEDIGKIFSKEYQKNSPGGTLVQTSGGKWLAKK